MASEVILLAAVSRNGVIGLENRMPWHLPADLAYFKATTLGHTLVMGHKTFLSIGRPLPKRRIIVLSRDTGLQLAGCEVMHTLTQALAEPTSRDQPLFIVGGAQLYSQCLAEKVVDQLYLTEIHADFAGDAFFPTWERTQWQETWRESHLADTQNPYAYDFVRYQRRV